MGGTMNLCRCTKTETPAGYVCVVCGGMVSEAGTPGAPQDNRQRAINLLNEMALSLDEGRIKLIADTLTIWGAGTPGAQTTTDAGMKLARELRRRCNTKCSLLHQSVWYEAANELEKFADSVLTSGGAQTTEPQSANYCSNCKRPMTEPNIADLEKMLNSEDDTRSIEIAPNGDVVQLTTDQTAEKRLRIALESNDVLRNEISRLKSLLRNIAKVASNV